VLPAGSQRGYPCCSEVAVDFRSYKRPVQLDDEAENLLLTILAGQCAGIEEYCRADSVLSEDKQVANDAETVHPKRAGTGCDGVSSMAVRGGQRHEFEMSGRSVQAFSI